MKIKRISILLCAALMLSSLPVFADEAQNANAPEVKTLESKAVAKTYTLSLADAIKMAQEKSTELAALNVTEKTTEYALKIAKQNKVKAQGARVVLPAGINMVLVQDGYIVMQKENELNLIKVQREQINSKIAYSVTEKYYNCILMQNLLNSAKDTYNLAVENKNKVDGMLAAGIITQIEADNAALAVYQTQLAVENYERQLALVTDTLKIALELSDEDFNNAKIVLTDNVVYEDFSADVLKDAESAKENRYDMQSLKGGVSLMEAYVEVIGRHLGSKSTTYTDATDDLANLNYNFSNAKKQIGVAIKSQYSNVLAAKGNIKAAEMSAEVSQKQYDAAKLRFDLGMITNIDLTDSLNKLQESEIALEQAKINYKLAVEKYKYEVKIGL